MNAIDASDPHPLRGAAWMVSAGVAFTVMSALIRPATAELHPLQVVFLRNMLGLLLAAPWLLRGVELRIWRSPNWKLHVLRACFVLAAMCCWFTGIGTLALAEAVTLGFTAPMFVTVFAALVLKEVFRARRCVALLVGFVGVLVVVRPGFEAFSRGQLLILLDALFWGGAVIMIRILSRREAANTIVAYMFMLVLPFSAIPAVFVWQWPSPWTWLLIAGIAVSSTIGHYCSTRAFAASEASLVMPFDYLRLLWFALAGYLFFNEVPDRYTLIGGAIIAASSLYVLHRERLVARQRSPAT